MQRSQGAARGLQENDKIVPGPHPLIVRSKASKPMAIKNPATGEVRSTEGLYVPTIKISTEKNLWRIDGRSRDTRHNQYLSSDAQLAQQHGDGTGHRKPPPAPVIPSAQKEADLGQGTVSGKVNPPKHASPESRWTPDVYAQRYIPKSLVAVNESPVLGTIHGRSVGGIDFHGYVLSFAGAYFLEPLPATHLFSSCETLQSTTQDSLCPENYHQFLFYHALDTQGQTQQIQDFNLYNVQLRSVDPIQNIYELSVPGLREGTPRVAVGDIVFMRQLSIDPKTDLPWDVPHQRKSDSARDAGQPSPGFTGYQLVPVIWGIDKTNEALMLQVNGIRAASPVCNIRFVVQPLSTSAVREAVEDISSVLQRPTECASSSNEWIRCMLFPSEVNGVYKESLPVGVFKETWVDQKLNYEQQKAVNAIRTQNYGKLPYIISGPPGTGKTKTICEAVMQLISDLTFRGSILLCAPSDAAADVLAIRLATQLRPKVLFRLNDHSRTFAEVPGELLPYCFVENEHFCIPPFPELMGCRVVVTTCRDTHILVQARVTNRDLASLQTNVAKTIDPQSGCDKLDVIPINLHWAALLIDEAAQATEPETLIPLSVTAPPTRCSQSKSPILVLAGDEHQLSPRTYGKSTMLSISLFERLVSCSVYNNHPESRKNRAASRHNDSRPILRPPFANLIRNYRSHPAIIAVPSSLFYHDSLVPEALNTDGMEKWSGWLGHRWPVLFACNSGLEECEDVNAVGGGGWYNAREANKAIAYALDLLSSGLINQPEICIMSPFRRQVDLLRQKARKVGLWDLNIGPMEAFQGLESRFVILCTTRSRDRFLKEDNARGLGIIGEAKRFNVAVTRAKEGLIVLGNPALLRQDPVWRAFLKFCCRNRLVQFEEGDSEANELRTLDEDIHSWCSVKNDTSDAIPNLEAALLYREREPRNISKQVHRFMSENQDDAMWSSGIIAEISLVALGTERSDYSPNSD